MDESEEIIKLKEIIKSRDLQIAELLHEIRTLTQITCIEETLDNVEVVVDNSDEPILTLNKEEEEEQLPDIMNMVNMFMGNSANPFSEIMKKMMVSEEEKEEDEDEDEEDKEE
jgi:hypothetical protein